MSTVASVVLPSGRVEYRLDRRGPRTAIIAHGGHLRAGVGVGEEALAEAGFTVLVPSRPGYGGTPVTSGSTDEQGFAGVVRELWRSLGMKRIDVVTGFSAGGPLAVRLAADNPDEVGALLLQSARSSLPWPDPITLSWASAVFEPQWEALVWATARSWMGLAPDLWLLTALAPMSRLPAPEVLADLSPAERDAVRGLFAEMRSGRGFTQDMRETPDPGRERQVHQPTLVIGSPHDGVLPFAHARHLADTIPKAELFASPSLSHLIWYGSGAGATRRRIADFLTELL